MNKSTKQFGGQFIKVIRNEQENDPQLCALPQYFNAWEMKGHCVHT